MSDLPIFLVLSRFFKFIQVSHERDRLTVSLWPLGPLPGILYLWSVWKLWHLTPDPLKCQFGLGGGRPTRGCSEGRAPILCLPGMNCTLWRSLLFEVVGAFHSWLMAIYILSFVFFAQLWWTWTILWLIWRPFKLSMRMWVTGKFYVWGCNNIYVQARCFHVLWGNLLRGHWIYITMGL